MPAQFIRRLTGNTRSRTADIQLGIMLAFIAGAINAGGFLAVGQYTSHMTGMVSAIADRLAFRHFSLALTALGFVFSFTLGAAVSTLIIRWARTRALQSEFALPLMLEALLLLIFGISAAKIPSAFALPLTTMIALLCFIMGVQNAIITKISRAEIRTTHVTGLITDIGIEIGRYLHGFPKKDLRHGLYESRLKLHLSLLFAFLAGGIVGALTFRHYGFVITIPLALLLLILAAVPVLDDLLKRRA